MQDLPSTVTAVTPISVARSSPMWIVTSLSVPAVPISIEKLAPSAPAVLTYSTGPPPPPPRADGPRDAPRIEYTFFTGFEICSDNEAGNLEFFETDVADQFDDELLDPLRHVAGRLDDRWLLDQLDRHRPLPLLSLACQDRWLGAPGILLRTSFNPRRTARQIFIELSC